MLAVHAVAFMVLYLGIALRFARTTCHRGSPASASSPAFLIGLGIVLVSWALAFLRSVASSREDRTGASADDGRAIPVSPPSDLRA
jgi:hypothetical protein